MCSSDLSVFAANQSEHDRSQGDLGILSSTGGSGAVLSRSEGRPVDSADLPPVGSTNRGAYIRRVPGLLLALAIANEDETLSSGTDASKRIGQAQHDQHGRRASADQRWEDGDIATTYHSRAGRKAAHGSVATGASGTTPAQDHVDSSSGGD